MTITSVGDVNVNIIRDFIYEKLQKVLTGKTIAPYKDEVILNQLTPAICRPANACTRIDLTEDHNEEIYYFNTGSLVLNGDIEYESSDKVVVVEGGNIHIKGNLEAKNSTNLGLIALRGQGDGLDKAHIYIGSDVTRIEALIVADGSLFSSNGPPYNEYGEPAAVDPEIFNKQMSFIGGTSTRNCLGCYDYAENFYYTPRGPLSIDNLANEAIAKKYDLNYLRYFSLGVIFAADGITPINLTCMAALNDPEYDTKCAGDEMEFKPYPEGDLAITDSESVGDDYTEIGQELVDAGVISETIKVTDKFNPLYIIYKPKSEQSYMFSEDKSLTF